MNLIFVPGLPYARKEGPQDIAFRAYKALWRVRGHNVAVHQFGWYHGQSFEVGMDRLGGAIKRNSGRVHMVGSSAGGLAVINALARYPDHVAGVLTVASPLSIPPGESEKYWAQERIPRLMHEAYNGASKFLNESHADLGKVVSVYGVEDSRISPAWSQIPGRIESHQIPGKTHSSIIFGAFALYCDQIERWIPS